MGSSLGKAADPVKCLVHKRFSFFSGGIKLVAKVKFKLSVEKITFEYEGDHDTGLAVNRAMNHTLGSLMEAQNQVIDVTPHEVERVSMPRGYCSSRPF